MHAAREKAEQLLRMVAGDPEQDAFVREVQRRVQGGEGGAVFLTAIGGGGKTTCLNAVIHWMISTGRHAVVTASSGVAANLLELGNTFHSTTRAPVKDTWEGEVPQCFDMHNHARDLKAQNLLRADAIIIDEATMMHRLLLDSLDLTLRTLTGATASSTWRCLGLLTARPTTSRS